MSSDHIKAIATGIIMADDLRRAIRAAGGSCSMKSILKMPVSELLAMLAGNDISVIFEHKTRSPIYSETS